MMESIVVVLSDLIYYHDLFMIFSNHCLALPSRAPYPCTKEKETHKLLFSWYCLWGHMHNVIDGNGDGVVQGGSHTPAKRLIETSTLGL